METFPSFPGAHLQVSSPAAPEPQQGALCYHFCSRTPHPTPAIRLAFHNPNRKACPNHRTPFPRFAREDTVTRPRVCRPGSPATPRGARRGQVKPARPRRPGRRLPYLPCGACGLRGGGTGCAAGNRIRDAAVHRAAGRGAGSGSEAARHCWGGRGRRVRAGASRPRARLDPRQPGGGPASPGRFHLRVGPCLRAPRRRLLVPAPAAARSQSAAKGRRAAAPGCGGGGGGADWARDARHARSA